MTTKTSQILAVIAVISVASGTLFYANTVNAQNLTTDDRHDILGERMLRLIVDNQDLANSDNQSDIAQYQDNLSEINQLRIEIDNLYPNKQTIQVDQELEDKVIQVYLDLRSNGFPVLSGGVNDSTGQFDIKVDEKRAYSGIDKEIKDFVGDFIEVNINYGPNDARFQGACVGQDGFCDPLIGASKGEPDHIEDLDCTVNIAATTGSGGSQKDVIVIPEHCNEHHVDYYQAVKTNSTHEVGPFEAAGGSNCDCQIVEVDSRTIDEDMINWDGDNVLIASRADLSVNDSVYMIGEHSGLDFGTIEKVNESVTIGSDTFTNVYFVSGINFNVSDSGAPIVKSGDQIYGGMNIGVGTETINGVPTTVNYVHDWTFLESELNLN